MELVKTFKYFHINKTSNLEDYLTSIEIYTENNNIEEDFINYIIENSEDRKEPKAGDLAKATAKEIGRAAVFGWIIGKVITKIINPTADKLGKSIQKGSVYVGDKMGKGARTAGKFVDSKTNISKKLAILNKSFKVSKNSVKGLVDKAKQYPVRTAGIAIGIILASIAAHKLYKVIKKRKELEAKRDDYLKKENDDLKRQIETINKSIEKLKGDELKVKIEYKKDLDRELTIAKNKAKDDPEYSIKLAKEANDKYSSLNSL